MQYTSLCIYVRSFFAAVQRERVVLCSATREGCNEREDNPLLCNERESVVLCCVTRESLQQRESVVLCCVTRVVVIRFTDFDDLKLRKERIYLLILWLK